MESAALDEQERQGRLAGRMDRAQHLERYRELAWSDIAETTREADDKTARLKILRLAKEQADAEAQEREAALKPAPSARKKPIVRKRRRIC